MFAAEEINAAGGVNGRMIKVVTRDTQGDPSKAVNAVQDLISREQVHAVWGPVNSGEALATTPIMARATMPNIHPCVIDSLINPSKYPNAFRIATANAQWDGAVVRYVAEILKLQSVAVLSDTTGYGTTANAASVKSLGADGISVAYKALIDSNQADVSADMLRARNAGAQAIVIWSVSTGLMARIINARGDMGWNVPIVGHPSLGSGEVAALLSKKDYWANVFQVGFRSASFGADGRLPPRSEAFIAKLGDKVKLEDTNFWWVAGGYDAVNLLAAAVQATGSTEAAAIIGNWNTLSPYPGVYGDYQFSPLDHNGFPNSEVVMSRANSFRNGCFALAPGYGN
jgi:branched-chain amino acid transport system substrate-binding protein